MASLSISEANAYQDFAFGARTELCPSEPLEESAVPTDFKLQKADEEAEE